MEWRPLYDILCAYLAGETSGYNGAIPSAVHVAVMSRLAQKARRHFSRDAPREIWAEIKPKIRALDGPACFEGLGALHLLMPCHRVADEEAGTTRILERVDVGVGGGVAVDAHEQVLARGVVRHLLPAGEARRAARRRVVRARGVPAHRRAVVHGGSRGRRRGRVPVRAADARPRGVPVRAKRQRRRAARDVRGQVPRAPRRGRERVRARRRRTLGTRGLRGAGGRPGELRAPEQRRSVDADHRSVFIRGGEELPRAVRGTRRATRRRAPRSVGSRDRRRAGQRGHVQRPCASSRRPPRASSRTSRSRFSPSSCVVSRRRWTTGPSPRISSRRRRALAACWRRVFIASKTDATDATDAMDAMDASSSHDDIGDGFASDAVLPSFADLPPPGTFLAAALTATIPGIDANDPSKTLGTIRLYAAAVSNAGVLADPGEEGSDERFPHVWSEWIDALLDRFFAFFENVDLGTRGSPTARIKQSPRRRRRSELPDGLELDVLAADASPVRAHAGSIAGTCGEKGGAFRALEHARGPVGEVGQMIMAAATRCRRRRRPT